MTHADTLAIPNSIKTKQQFYSHVISTLSALLSPSPPPSIDYIKRNWITLLSNASSLLSGSFENFSWGKEDGSRVNWTGFYLHPSVVFGGELNPSPPVLLLGPFAGRPACLEVSLTTNRPGVCASSWLEKQTILVPDVEERVGHIACDSVTKSEIVVPIIITRKDGSQVVVGVLDVDCEAKNGFDQEDVDGLELFVQELIKLIDWGI